jgi:hypothetical protein
MEQTALLLSKLVEIVPCGVHKQPLFVLAEVPFNSLDSILPPSCPVNGFTEEVSQPLTRRPCGDPSMGRSPRECYSTGSIRQSLDIAGDLNYGRDRGIFTVGSHPYYSEYDQRVKGNKVAFEELASDARDLVCTAVDRVLSPDMNQNMQSLVSYVVSNRLCSLLTPFRQLVD